MGNYTEKAFQGFLKDPGTDRKAVVEQLTKAMGGTMHSMDIVRGSYDFVVVVDLTSFDDFAAIKLVKLMCKNYIVDTTCSNVRLNDVRKIWSIH